MNMCIMLRQIAICFTHGPSNISVTHIFFMLNAYGALLVNISTLLQPLNYLCIMGDTHVFQHFHYFLPLLSTPISRESLLNYSCTTCVLHVFPRRIEARFVSLYTKFWHDFHQVYVEVFSASFPHAFTSVTVDKAIYLQGVRFRQVTTSSSYNHTLYLFKPAEYVLCFSIYLNFFLLSLCCKASQLYKEGGLMDWNLGWNCWSINVKMAIFKDI